MPIPYPFSYITGLVRALIVKCYQKEEDFLCIIDALCTIGEIVPRIKKAITLENIIATNIYGIALVIRKLPFSPVFFHEIVVARILGEGSRAYAAKQYDEAFNILKETEPLNFKDNYLSSSHYLLGLLYHQGLGTKLDRERGLSLLKRAASGGNDDAANYIKWLPANDE